MSNEIPRRLESRQNGQENGEHKEIQNGTQYGVRNGTQNGEDSVDECCQISLGMVWILKVFKYQNQNCGSRFGFTCLWAVHSQSNSTTFLARLAVLISW